MLTNITMTTCAQDIDNLILNCHFLFLQIKDKTNVDQLVAMMAKWLQCKFLKITMSQLPCPSNKCHILYFLCSIKWLFLFKNFFQIYGNIEWCSCSTGETSSGWSCRRKSDCQGCCTSSTNVAVTEDGHATSKRSSFSTIWCNDPDATTSTTESSWCTYHSCKPRSCSTCTSTNHCTATTNGTTSTNHCAATTNGTTSSSIFITTSRTGGHNPATTSTCSAISSTWPTHSSTTTWRRTIATSSSGSAIGARHYASTSGTTVSATCTTNTWTSSMTNRHDKCSPVTRTGPVHDTTTNHTAKFFTFSRINVWSAGSNDAAAATTTTTTTTNNIGWTIPQSQWGVCFQCIILHFFSRFLV